jgi:hypothetical protein
MSSPGTVTVKILIVGCDQRSESNGWCAGTGDFRVTWAWHRSEVLRAGTPRFRFSPLVTPYEELKAAAGQTVS